MKILITGGAGFIGSHLAERLLKEGHKVTIIDDLSTGSLDNIAHLKRHPKFKYYVEGVLKNAPLLKRLINSSDLIFHLAAAVGVELIVREPVHTIETNIRGTDIVLDFAQKGKKKVIIASTSEVYGKSRHAKFREDHDLVLGPTTHSRWSYAASKIIDEFLALAFHREKRVPTVVIRFFNVVGPRQTGMYGMVIPRFVEQALKNKPITVYGSGRQIRTFLHVYDAVDALMKLAFTPKVYGQIYNVGGKESLSIYELARRVKKLLKSSSKITFIPYDKAYEEGFEDMDRRIPDIRKIKKAVGWRPKRKLNEAIKNVAEYHRTKL